jgi:glutaredoxin|tara:strand:+ start:1732 stop:2052 length:321 start_codon:yes stop_codon:yes gene_type:complete
MQQIQKTRNLKSKLLLRDVVVYSKDNCPFCVKAKGLLDKLKVDYTTKNVGQDITLEELYKELKKQVRSVPQIVINGELIGGYNQLVEHLCDLKLINFKGDKVEEKG